MINVYTVTVIGAHGYVLGVHHHVRARTSCGARRIARKFYPPLAPIDRIRVELAYRDR